MNEDLVDEIGDVEYEFAEPPAAPLFVGWHRPRKHFVRLKQWIACAQDLMQDRPRDEPLKYFGLPGTDLLDIRALYTELCSPNGRDLLFRGHAQEASQDRSAATRLEITLQQLKQLPGIDPNSDVKGDPLEACASTRSVAYQDTVLHGPYDIVNIDLCNGFFGRSPGNASLYSAVENLLALQARRTRPWLLFVSGVVDPTAVSAEVLVPLEELVASAIEDCEPLSTQITESLGRAAGEWSLADLNSAEFSMIVNLSLMVWLTNRVMVGHPAKVKLRSALGYRTLPEAPAPDFFSLAFEFIPVVGPVASDPSGLSSATSVVPIDPCKSQTAAAKRLRDPVDVDDRLRVDDDLRRQMIDGSRELLEWARYDPAAYLTWVSDFES